MGACLHWIPMLRTFSPEIRVNFLRPLQIATENILSILQLLCLIYVFSYHRHLGFILSNCGHGAFNTRNDLNACCAHKKAMWALTCRTSFGRAEIKENKTKRGLHPVSTGNWTHGGCFHWTTAQRINHWATGTDLGIVCNRDMLSAHGTKYVFGKFHTCHF